MSVHHGRGGLNPARAGGSGRLCTSESSAQSGDETDEEKRLTGVYAQLLPQQRRVARRAGQPAPSPRSSEAASSRKYAFGSSSAIAVRASA